MPETSVDNKKRGHAFLRYRGRGAQVAIYLGKFLRMFVYQNDWKVLPMAAVIAGVVAMVIRDGFFQTKEGTVMGAFALSCVAIWNGCFNSIQVVCRERDVVKREHRSGMHVSSYVAAHLIYQALLCLLQTGVTLYVLRFVGVKFPLAGQFTPWMIADVGITMFLISFTADALALWISSLARTTTAAMTLVPFLLIFQLVFSGGMLSLPDWCGPVTKATISNYGMTALTAQGDYNNLPTVSLWWSLVGMRDKEINVSVTAGQVMDYLSDARNPGVADLRETPLTLQMTARELGGLLRSSGADAAALAGGTALLDAMGDEPLSVSFTLGEAVDQMANDPLAQGERDRVIPIRTTVGQIIDLFGEGRTYQALQDMAGKSDPKYERTRDNVLSCWGMLILFTLGYAAMATVTLEFIDKDKR